MKLESLSVVVPCYRSRESLPELVDLIEKNSQGLTDNLKIILVDDGCPDNSWEMIEEIGKTNRRVVGIKLSKNFGQHYAITAGLKLSKSEATIVMDCDLQDHPKFFPDLIRQFHNGYRIVFTKKKTREHPFIKNIFGLIFHKIFNFLVSNNETNKEIGNFSLLDKHARECFCRIEDYQRHYLLVLRWIGFSSTVVSIDHYERHSGLSSYTFLKSLKHAVNGIVGQSNRLLYFSTMIAFVVLVLSTLGAAALIVSKIYFNYQEGWVSLVVVMLFSLALMLFSVGINGLYISRIFDQVKNRPLFIIDKIASHEDL